MSRYATWLAILAALVGCKFFGVGDGSVAKEAIWSALALANHWASNRSWS